MELDYSKKDITKAPKMKAAPEVNPIPEGYEVYEKRGLWHLQGNGTHEIFKTEQEAIEWLTK
mgnify:CR=1 FL=1|tara:strand:+ start:655 stop:840 length:186 start_codon:yes stop_codon:yes gene_type:complete